MKKTVLSLFVVSLSLVACNNGGGGDDYYPESENGGMEGAVENFENEAQDATYEEVKNSADQVQQTLKEKEQQNPLQFLEVRGGTYRKNLLGEFVCEGSIANVASEATFKDVTLRIKYYTKTDTYLGSEDVILHEYYDPGYKKSFKIKKFGYKNATQVGFDIVNAGVAYNK